MATARGDSNMSKDVRHLPHKASRLLHHLRLHGAGVWTSTPPWAIQRRDAAVHRGAHQSAHQDREFVFDEMLDFCRQGYWLVLPYEAVRGWDGLRLSPIGAVPQRDRRPRLIVDYSFSEVNDETVLLAPAESMQFGRALQRILKTIVEADPRYGPVYLSKIDIADGFYRVWLRVADIPKLGVVLPMTPGQPPIIAFPLTLPMGWVESPPYFTVLTETACDLANDHLRRRGSKAFIHHPAHRLETVAATPPADVVPFNVTGVVSRERLRSRGCPPVASVDVYVDDFILMAQTHVQRREVLRSALTAIDQVFRPLEPADPEHRKEPASIKKMQKGDACWSTTKRILGWDLDTQRSTINLPAHRVARLYELLDLLKPPCKRVSVKIWHQLLGELRSMSPALPGSRGLFSILQESLRCAGRNRVRVTAKVRHMADDFRAIADSLQIRPTRLQELVPTAPTYMGACDACGQGMGGVWFHTSPEFAHTPLVWRQSFDRDVQRALITSDNPHGTLSISDLELMALIAHKDVLAQHHPVAERTMWLATDNRAALSWSTKGSSTSTAARAYLLRFNSLHQRTHRYVATHNHIAGRANGMADDASCMWHLSDNALLTHFNLRYPQASPWQLLTLPPSVNSALTGALFRRQPAHVSRTSAPLPVGPHGRVGASSAQAWRSTPTTSHLTPSHSCKSSLNDCAQAPLQPAATVCDLARWKTPSAQWARRMPGWGPRTLA